MKLLRIIIVSLAALATAAAVSCGSSGSHGDSNTATNSGTATATSTGTASSTGAGTDTGTGTITVPPSIDNSVLEIAVKNEPYSHTLTASGGAVPYIWSAAGLPSGLAMSNSGTISGTPENSGLFSVVLTVTGSNGLSECATAELAVYKPMGWDYNLTKRCVQSTLPAESCYYSDMADDPGGNRSWTVGVQAEVTLGCSSVGPNGQSLPINDNSILSLTWTPNTDEFGRPNYIVDILTDVSQYSHPGGAGNFTWFSFMDHTANGGGPWPRPDKCVLRIRANYNDYTPHGSARFILGFGAFWDGKYHGIEINIVSTNWGDAHPDADIVSTVCDDTMEFVNMDGLAMGLSIPKENWSDIEVDWGEIVQDLVDRGILSAPTGGWAATGTGSISAATEANNWTVSNSVITRLQFTNFRILEKP